MPRKEKTIHFIYKTTNIINEKYYIGMHSTNNINDGYIGSGKRLWHSIKKYGKENFKLEVLETLPDRKSLKERERELIQEDTLNDKMCMNLVYGGGGGFISPEGTKLGRKVTDKILLNRYGENFRSIILKRFYNNLTEMDRKNLTEKIKDGQKKSGFNHNTFLGKSHTEIAKRKIGEKNSLLIGEKNSQFGTCWITNGVDNKKIKKSDVSKFVGWTLGRKMKK